MGRERKRENRRDEVENQKIKLESLISAEECQKEGTKIAERRKLSEK